MLFYNNIFEGYEPMTLSIFLSVGILVFWQLEMRSGEMVRQNVLYSNYSQSSTLFFMKRFLFFFVIYRKKFKATQTLLFFKSHLFFILYIFMLTKLDYSLYLLISAFAFLFLLILESFSN